MALTDFFTRKYKDSLGDSYSVALARLLFSLPVLWIFFPYDDLPQINSDIMYILLSSIPLEILALLLYIKAIKVSPLSMTLPFLAFTPVFLIFTAPLLLSEEPSQTGYLGIILIVIGSYMLNFSKIDKGLLTPFKSILKEKGSLLMLGVALIYSLTSCLTKIGMEFSSPIFFATIYFSLITLIVFILLPDKKKIHRLFTKEYLVIGLSSGLMILFHFLAIELIIVNYMISIKRSSLVIGIFLGGIFLHEKNWLEKIMATIIIFIGIIIITVFSK